MRAQVETVEGTGYLVTLTWDGGRTVFTSSSLVDTMARLRRWGAEVYFTC